MCLQESKVSFPNLLASSDHEVGDYRASEVNTTLAAKSRHGVTLSRRSSGGVISETVVGSGNHVVPLDAFKARRYARGEQVYAKLQGTRWRFRPMAMDGTTSLQETGLHIVFYTNPTCS